MTLLPAVFRRSELCRLHAPLWSHLILAGALVGLLAACGAYLAPETPRERLVAAEADYEAAVSTVRDMLDRGLIHSEAGNAVATAIASTRTALDFWHLAPDNLDRMQAGIAALTTLQTLIRATKGQQSWEPEPSWPSTPPTLLSRSL